MIAALPVDLDAALIISMDQLVHHCLPHVLWTLQVVLADDDLVEQERARCSIIVWHRKTSNLASVAYLGLILSFRKIVLIVYESTRGRHLAGLTRHDLI